MKHKFQANWKPKTETQIARTEIANFQKCRNQNSRAIFQTVRKFPAIDFVKNTNQKNESAKVIANLAQILAGIFTRGISFAAFQFARIHFQDTEIRKFRAKFADTKSRIKEIRNYFGIPKTIFRFANLATLFNARSSNADLEIQKQKFHSEIKAKHFRFPFAFRIPFKINDLIWWNFRADFFKKVGRRIEIFTETRHRRPRASTTKIREIGKGHCFQRFTDRSYDSAMVAMLLVFSDLRA